MEERVKKNNKILLIIFIILIIVVFAVTLIIIGIHKDDDSESSADEDRQKLSVYEDLKNKTEESENKLTEMKVKQFNAKLEIGIGENVTGTAVRNMLEAIKTMKKEDSKLLLNVTYANKTEADEIIPLIRPALKYNVKATKDLETGLINTIIIENK